MPVRYILAHLLFVDQSRMYYMSELILKQECFQIVGAAMEVYNTLGPGFLEAVYQEALEIELAARDICFVSQKELQILYKG